MELESVGTHMRADGWTYPMLVDDCNRYRGYAQWAGVHLLDIEPDGDWMTALSDDDRKIVVVCVHHNRDEGER